MGDSFDNFDSAFDFSGVDFSGNLFGLFLLISLLFIWMIRPENVQLSWFIEDEGLWVSTFDWLFDVLDLIICIVLRFKNILGLLNVGLHYFFLRLLFWLLTLIFHFKLFNNLIIFFLNWFRFNLPFLLSLNDFLFLFISFGFILFFVDDFLLIAFLLILLSCLRLQVFVCLFDNTYFLLVSFALIYFFSFVLDFFFSSVNRSRLFFNLFNFVLNRRFDFIFRNIFCFLFYPILINLFGPAFDSFFFFIFIQCFFFFIFIQCFFFFIFIQRFFFFTFIQCFFFFIFIQCFFFVLFCSFNFCFFLVCLLYSLFIFVSLLCYFWGIFYFLYLSHLNLFWFFFSSINLLSLLWRVFWHLLLCYLFFPWKISCGGHLWGIYFSFNSLISFIGLGFWFILRLLSLSRNFLFFFNLLFINFWICILLSLFLWAFVAFFNFFYILINSRWLRFWALVDHGTFSISQRGLRLLNFGFFINIGFLNFLGFFLLLGLFLFTFILCFLFVFACHI